MMDAMGDSEKAWRNAMAQAEKVDRLNEGRKETRRFINVGTLSPGWSHDRRLKDTFSCGWNHHSGLEIISPGLFISVLC